MHSKLDTLLFIVEDEGLEYFSEQLEPQLPLLKLRSVLLNTETLPATEAGNFFAKSDQLKEKHFEVWCELVLCLDIKTLSLIKCLKLSGTAALRELQTFSKRKERPRSLNSQTSYHTSEIRFK